MGQACRRVKSDETHSFVHDLHEPSKMMKLHEVCVSAHEALAHGRTAGKVACEGRDGLRKMTSGILGRMTETVEKAFASMAPHHEIAKKGKDTDVLQMYRQVTAVSWLQEVSQTLPAGLRICILGGSRFKEPRSECIVKALSQEFALRISDSAVFITGGMPGVQETFSNGLGNDFKGTLFHLLPRGQSSNFAAGRDIVAGADLSERMDVFASIGEVYICIEGGPGVAKEARDACARHAFVLPVISTGGASSGQFDFPAHPLHRPAFVSEARWSMITQPAEPAAAATAIVDIVLDVLNMWKDDNNLSSESLRPASAVTNATAELMRALKSHSLSLAQLEEMLAIVTPGPIVVGL